MNVLDSIRTRTRTSHPAAHRAVPRESGDAAIAAPEPVDMQNIQRLIAYFCSNPGMAHVAQHLELKRTTAPPRCRPKGHPSLCSRSAGHLDDDQLSQTWPVVAEAEVAAVVFEHRPEQRP